ncbi:MAG: ribonuclease VapC [Methanobacterium sp.]
MEKKTYVLDASAIIGGFYSKSNSNFTTSEVILEIKDLKSSLLIQSAMENGNLQLEEPDKEDIEKTNKIIESSGDILRLSETDKNIIALALKLKRTGYNPIVVTDDYSMQNSLKIINLPFKSVLTEGITEVYNWIKICKGCKKKYPSDYSFEDCEICGSPVIKRRIKTKK